MATKKRYHSLSDTTTMAMDQCVCRTIDLADVLKSLSHVVHGFSAMSYGGTISQR